MIPFRILRRRITYVVSRIGFTFNRQVQDTIKLFKEKDPGRKKFFDTSQGYAVFPTVGKGGFGIGAARGKGLMYEASVGGQKFEFTPRSK
jgi:hypothetical protein